MATFRPRALSDDDETTDEDDNFQTQEDPRKVETSQSPKRNTVTPMRNVPHRNLNHQQSSGSPLPTPVQSGQSLIQTSEATDKGVDKIMSSAATAREFPKKLGVIGGKAARKDHKSVETPQDVPAEAASSPVGVSNESRTVSRPKLGTIGGRNHDNAAQLPRMGPRSLGKDDIRGENSETTRGRESPVATVIKSPPSGRITRVEAADKETPQRKERETSQERADRRREELKNELEHQSRGPVKKKRKF